MLNLIIFAYSIILLACGATLLKMGATELKKVDLAHLLRLPLIFGAICYGMSALLFVYLLKSYDLSYLYPLTASGYIIVTLFSVTILGEKMHAYKWAALSLIIIGCVLITL